MGRLTDNDRHLGRFITYGRSSFNALRLVYSSGAREGDAGQNNLTAYAFGWVARLRMPNLLPDFKVRHKALSWDAATIERLGRDWYEERFPREYGFSLHEGFLQLFLGSQTHDSTTTQSWCTHLPWTQWRFVRYSIYGQAGEHFYTELEADRIARRKAGETRIGFEDQFAAKEAVPKIKFLIEDFDGKRIVASTCIEVREWAFGERWCKWLSLFRANMVRRSLDISFAEEVGPDKGSWKGGLCGTGIEMLDGELHEAAFRRYCEQQHRSKNGSYRITFVSRA